MANIGELSVGVKVDQGALTTMTKNIQDQATASGKALEDNIAKKGKQAFAEAENSAKALSNTLNTLKNTILTVFGVTAIVNFGKNVLTLANNLEQNTVAFTTMLGSAEKAKTLLQDLSDFAKKTPFTLVGIRESAKQLLAFGIPAADMMKTIKMLGDVAAGTGTGLDRISYAYGQIRTAGTLYGQDLRQLTEAGVPLLAQLAKQYGVSEQAAKKMVENGKIGFADVEKAFQTMTSEGGKFFNLMDNQSKTLGGVWSNLVDTFNSLLEKVGTGLIPVFESLISVMQWMIVFIQSAEGKATLLAAAVGILTFGFISLIPVLGGVAVAFTAAAATGGTLAGVLAILGGPITLISVGLAALAGGAYYAYEAFNGLTGATAGLQAQLNDLKDQQDKNKKAFEDGTISQDEYTKKTEQNVAAQKQLQTAIDEVTNGTVTYESIKTRINNLKKIADVDAYQRETNVIETQIAALKELIRVKSINANQALESLKIAQAREANTPQTGQGGTTLLMDATAAYRASLNDPAQQKANAEIAQATAQVKSLEDALKKAGEARKALVYGPSGGSPSGSGAGGSGSAKKETQEVTYEVGKLKDAYSDLKNKKKELDDVDKKYSEANLKRLADGKKALNEIGDKIKENQKQYDDSLKKIADETNKKNQETTGSYVRDQAVKQVDVEKQLKDLDAEIAKEKALAAAKGQTLDSEALIKQRNLEQDIAETQLRINEFTSNTSAATRLTAQNRLLDLQTQLTALKTAKDYDENTAKLLEYEQKRTELNQQLTDVKSNIANLSKSEAANMDSILATERARAALSDTKKSEFDYQQKLKQIADEKKAQDDAAKAKFDQDQAALERQKAIYDFFQSKTSFTPVQLKKLLASDQFKNATGEDQNLITKLATELIALTQQKEKKFALEQELADSTTKLQDAVNQNAIKNVQKLKKEYQDLIAEINAAIAAQAQLSASKNTARGFADGGFTGPGGVNDVAGVVHKGEYVLSQNMLGKLPGIIPALEAVRTGNNIDQSRSVAINGPITMNEALDFEIMLRRAKFLM